MAKKNCILIVLNLIIVLVLLSQLRIEGYGSIQKEEVLKEERAIEGVIKQFIEACMVQDYERALELSGGGLKRYLFKAFMEGRRGVRRKKMKGFGMDRSRSMKKSMKNYFNRLRNYEVEVVVVGDMGEKGIGVVRFEFNGNHWNKRKKLKKVREVHYYLKKEKKKWKIISSKLEREKWYQRR